MKKKNNILKSLLGLSFTSLLLLSGCEFINPFLSEVLQTSSSEDNSSESSSEKISSESSSENISSESSSEKISSESSSENNNSSSNISSSENENGGNLNGDGVLKEIYSIGFEASEGYTAATAYDNTSEKLHGPENYQWAIVMGTPTTTDKISGDQSVQMRYYASTKPGNYGYVKSTFKFDEATELTFKAKSTASNGVKVEMSVDGTTWTNPKNYSLTTSTSNNTYTISEKGEDVYLRFTLVSNATSGTSRLTIDDVVVKGFGVAIENENFSDQPNSSDTNPDDGGLTSSDLSSIESTINSYYSSISSTYTGSTLWSKLQDATNPNQLTSYGDLRYAKATGKSIGGNLDTDYDTSNTSNLIDFYSGLSFTGEWDDGATWNREHVWCQSHGWWGEVKNSEKNAGSDLHHLRPTISSINSSRNNSLYGEVSNRTTQAKYYSFAKGTKATSTDEGATLYGYLNANVDPRPNEGVFEPTDRMKGDIARIIMYLLVRYKDVATPVTNIIYTSEGTVDAAYALLLKWHQADPVSNFEIRRNHETYKIQGNRNPFIDNPSYAAAIWG